MRILGRHIIAEFVDCDSSLLNDMAKIRTILTEAARQSGATVVDSVFHHYNPHGLSGVVVIAESHLSIHTWPEYGYASVDFYTCGNRVDPWRACHYMREQLKCRDIFTKELHRGIPSEFDEALPHKPQPIPFSLAE